MNVRLFLFCVISALAPNAVAAQMDLGWQHRQDFSLATTGLVRTHLPLETLDALRPSLGDLRLTDADGREIPYAIIQHAPTEPAVKSASNIRVEMRSQETVLEMETGIAHPLRGLTLATPATGFLKAVRVEGSNDGRAWTPLQRGVPIFRHPNGASQLHINISPNIWQRLRIFVDDRTTKPIPFTGAILFAAIGDEPAVETRPVAILERAEEPGETRLLLDFGAAQLRLVSVSVSADDAIFRRPLMLSVKREADGIASEQNLGTATIYRMNLDELPVVSQTDAVYELTTPARQLILRIRNDDSPPLKINNILARYRPLDVVYLAEKPGKYSFYSGNPSCPPAHYDIEGLKAGLQSAKPVPIVSQPLQANPLWRKPEILPAAAETGAEIDVKPWRFRKKVQIEMPGIQQIELDQEILSQTAGYTADMRLMHNRKQVPYVMADMTNLRSFSVSPQAEFDAQQPSIGRWQIGLEFNNLPIAELKCFAHGPLFQRDLTLYEISRESKKGHRILGAGRMIRTSVNQPTECVINLQAYPTGDTLFLETENGDNTPITIERCEVSYRTKLILFKTSFTDEISLYYGNQDARPPQYDLNLVASELMAAEKHKATLGRQEQIRKLAWHEQASLNGKGMGGWILWLALALVVVGLLGVMARLLPKA